MDVEIASVSKKKLIMKPFEEPEDIQQFPEGLIENENWSIVYKKEGGVLNNYTFFLRDKHLYSTCDVNQILERAKANKTNIDSDIKFVSDMTKWYLAFRASLLKIMPKIFDAPRQQ
ncbi:unnamed protein product [Lactuca saligna]|uniref:Uncharacterized protein n=1 Tax=Lactuca saligna TaxID=75948 RepID=A0AA35VH96_LACSI|nr:unnamed protein product [Lactuca saligna]